MVQKDVIVLNCSKCGEDFLYEYRGSGRKPDYCPECRKLINREAAKVYKLKNVEKPAEIEFSENNFVDRIAELLNSLDTIRVNMCELASEMNTYQSTYDKTDQVFLHKIEDANLNDAKEAQKLLLDWQKSRNGRRNVKDYIMLLRKVIEAIPYKNYANALPILKNGGYVVKPRRSK